MALTFSTSAVRFVTFSCSSCSSCVSVRTRCVSLFISSALLADCAAAFSSWSCANCICDASASARAVAAVSSAERASSCSSAESRSCEHTRITQRSARDRCGAGVAFADHKAHAPHLGDRLHLLLELRDGGVELSCLDVLLLQLLLRLSTQFMALLVRANAPTQGRST